MRFIEVDIEWADVVIVQLEDVGCAVRYCELWGLGHSSQNGLTLVFWCQHIHIIVAVYEVAFTNYAEECTVERYQIEVLEPEEDALVQERQFCGVFLVTSHLYLGL